MTPAIYPATRPDRVVHRAPPSRRPSKFSPLPVAALESDGTFRGYASLFNRVDLGRDRVLPGAFTASVARRGAGGVRMLFQHDPAQVIGTWRVVREDPAGLWVEGHLSPDVAKAREVRALMRSGALDGLSIGYHTVRARRDPRSGVRSIVEADLWEVSVVTFPMLPEARVTEVKAGASRSVRDIERMLRRDAGLTRREAKAMLAARGSPARDAPVDPLAARIREAVDLIRTH